MAMTESTMPTPMRWCSVMPSSRPVSLRPAQPQQHDTVLEGDPHCERQHGEDAGSSSKPRAPSTRLQNDVGVGLRERNVVDSASGLDGQDAEDALGLLHLLQAAEPPWVLGAAAGVVDTLGLHHGASGTGTWRGPRAPRHAASGTPRR